MPVRFFDTIQYSLFLTLTIALFSTVTKAETSERRMAIEIGSSAIEYAIADVDPDTDTIITYKDRQSIVLHLHDDVLANKDHRFSSDMMAQAADIMKQLREKANYYLATEIAVVGTEALRLANNRHKLLHNLQREIGTKIMILSEQDEDRMDYFTAIRISESQGMPVVWDIGANSFLLIATNQKSEILSYNGDYGSQSFMNYVVEVIQGKELKGQASIHPLNQQHYQEALRFAHHLASRAPESIKQHIVTNKGEVVALGSLFQYSLLSVMPNLEGQRTILRRHLESYLQQALNRESKEDHNTRQEPLPHQLTYKPHSGFSHLTLSNAIMVYGFMLELGIEKLSVSERTSTDSMLEYSPFWQ